MTQFTHPFGCEVVQIQVYILAVRICDLTLRIICPLITLRCSLRRKLRTECKTRSRAKACEMSVTVVTTLVLPYVACAIPFEGSWKFPCSAVCWHNWQRLRTEMNPLTVPTDKIAAGVVSRFSVGGTSLKANQNSCLYLTLWEAYLHYKWWAAIYMIPFKAIGYSVKN